MKQFLSVLSFLCLFCFFVVPTSCSDDDETQDVINDEAEDPEDPEAQRIADSLRSVSILSELAAYDSISGKYTPHLGEAIYPEHPEWYYLIADSVEQARQYFLNMFCDSTVVAGGNNTLICRFDAGSLTFNPTSTADYVAVVDVNVPVISNMKKLVFIRSSEWPHNDDSPMRWGQIWRRTCKGEGNGWLYFCATDFNCLSNEVRLMTFDGGWVKDHFGKYTHWQGSFDVYGNCASKEAFLGLNNYVQNIDSKRQILEDLKTFGLGNTRMYKMLQAIYNKDKGLDFNVGTHSYGHHLWWAYNCYDVTITYYSAKDRKIWSKYYTHKKKPVNGGEGWANRNSVSDPKYGVSSEYTIKRGTTFKEGSNYGKKIIGNDTFELILDNGVF